MVKRGEGGTADLPLLFSWDYTIEIEKRWTHSQLEGA